MRESWPILVARTGEAPLERLAAWTPLDSRSMVTEMEPAEVVALPDRPGWAAEPEGAAARQPARADGS